MAPIFTKLFVMSMEASNVFGCSIKFTIRLKDGCFLVFKTLISFTFMEKKATWLPATRKERIKSRIAKKIKTVSAAGERTVNNKLLPASTE